MRIITVNAVLTAIILIVLVSGAALTSSVTDASPLGDGAYRSAHRTIGWVAGMLAAAAALVITASRGNATVRNLAWTGVGVFAVEAILGLTSLRDGSAGVRIAHACVAPVFLSIAAAVAVMSGKPWSRPPELVPDYGTPSMRTMSVISPVLVMLQIAMGAAFRHQAMGVMPHILGALLVALFMMIAGAFAMQQFPTHPTIRPTALWMLAITGVQVMLGMTAFIMRMMSDSASAGLIAASVAHVSTGALTLAASVVLMMEIRRNVTPKA